MNHAGAGKTTLINILAGLYSASSGAIKINGVTLTPSNRSIFVQHLAYVRHSTPLHAESTVSELIRFAANLRLPTHTPSTVKRHRVDHLIKQLNLTTCKNTKVGKLSGGEHKRVAVAVEMVTEPSSFCVISNLSWLDLTGLSFPSRLASIRRANLRVCFCLSAVDASILLAMFFEVLIR